MRLLVTRKATQQWEDTGRGMRPLGWMDTDGNIVRSTVIPTRYDTSGLPIEAENIKRNCTLELTTARLEARVKAGVDDVSEGLLNLLATISNPAAETSLTNFNEKIDEIVNSITIPKGDYDASND